jgi:translocator protein
VLCNILKVNGEKYVGKLILSIVLAELVGVISSFFGMSNESMYIKINRPFFSPPGWIFPIVWTILFLLMGIAAYRVWVKGSQGEDVKNHLFYMQFN